MVALLWVIHQRSQMSGCCEDMMWPPMPWAAWSWGCSGSGIWHGVFPWRLFWHIHTLEQACARSKLFAFNLRDMIETHQKLIKVSQGFLWVVEAALINHKCWLKLIWKSESPVCLGFARVFLFCRTASSAAGKFLQAVLDDKFCSFE